MRLLHSALSSYFLLLAFSAARADETKPTSGQGPLSTSTAPQTVEDRREARNALRRKLGLLHTGEFPQVPKVDPGQFPEGTVFSVVMSPTGEIAWAPSQDPNLPPVRSLQGKTLPVVSYNAIGLPHKPPSGLFAVERSGGHTTIAQIMYIDSLSQAEKDALVGLEYIDPVRLRGYFCATVVFERDSNGWKPRVISWKSTNLNLPNFRYWLQFGSTSSDPPEAFKQALLTELTSQANSNSLSAGSCDDSWAAIAGSK